MQKNNWLTSQIRTSARSDDIEELQAWNSSIERGITSVTSSSLETLRFILGDILTHMNEISNVFRIGVKYPTPEVVQRAKELLSDISNIERLHDEVQRALGIISTQKMPEPQRHMLKSILYSILNMNFTPQQKEQFIALSHGQVPAAFASEVNLEKIQNLLRSTIYASSDPKESTLVVFREALQNAADAAMIRYREDPSIKPRIDVYTHAYFLHGKKFLDMTMVDNGTGMNWDILSRKFFVLGESGKEEEAESTGGFGIAKAKIFESPEHGWSVDTLRESPIHSSRFGRNIYMGTYPPTSYNPPPSKLQTSRGTTINLYKLPDIYDYNFADLAKKFASDTLTVVINGNEITPQFSLNDMTPIGDDLSGIVSTMADSDVEVEAASKIINDRTEDTTATLGDLQFPGTVINFYLRKKEYGGKAYYLLNGQYQFERSLYLSGADIICSIKTKLRPGSADYPVDPGRENLRSPYKEQVSKTIQVLKDILDKISNSQLFKEGLDIRVFNEEFEPLYTDREEAAYERRRLKSRLQQKVTGSLGISSLFTPEEEQKVDVDVHSGDLASAIRNSTQGEALDERQVAIVEAAIGSMGEEQKKKLNVQKELDTILEGISTPVAVSIQHNFVSRKMANEDPYITANLILLWSNILRKIVNQVSHFAKSSKTYMPGVIYSDKALALYQPAKHVPYDTISINPLTVASIIHPGAFDKWIVEDRNSDAFKDANNTVAFDQTPIKRVAAFLFHSAIHEVTHMLFPDYYGNDSFHNYVTHLETSCHFLFPDIVSDVKRYMSYDNNKKGLKADSMLLIQILRDEKRAKEGVKTRGRKREERFYFSAKKWNYKFGNSIKDAYNKEECREAHKKGWRLHSDDANIYCPLHSKAFGAQIPVSHEVFKINESFLVCAADDCFESFPEK